MKLIQMRFVGRYTILFCRDGLVWSLLTSIVVPSDGARGCQEGHVWSLLTTIVVPSDGARGCQEGLVWSLWTSIVDIK